MNEGEKPNWPAKALQSTLNFIEKKYPIFVMLTCIGIILSIIFNITAYYVPSIESYSPFRVEVFGSFTDWLMVFVTILTAVYLVKTFRSQTEVNRVSVLPIFTIENIGNKDVGIKHLKLVKNNAYYVAQGNTGEYFTIDNNSICFDVPVTSLMKEGEIRHLSNLNYSATPYKAYLIFSFKDVYGNDYTQRIFYKGRGRYTMQPPVLKGRK
jgi:hypothetical protein